MAARLRRLATVTAILVVTPSCTTWSGCSGGVAFERHLQLPPDIAAALAAGAMRQVFPFADPVAHAAGAPATRQEGGWYTIRYEQDRRGAWLPNAEHRLRLTPAPDGAAPLTVTIAGLTGDHSLASLGKTAAGIIELTIRSPGAQQNTGCRVTASAPPELLPLVAAALDHTFAIAEDEQAPPVGLAEPNLRTFVGNRLLQSAAELLRHGQPQRAAEHLHLAARLDCGVPAQQRRLGDLACRTGDTELARPLLLQAVLVTTDPTTRAELATRLAGLDTPGGGTEPSLRAAGRSTQTLDPGVTAIRLHTARRQRAEPARDYERLGEVHSQGNNEMGELACALLAREHTPAAVAFADRSDDAMHRGLHDFARRVKLGITTVLAESAAQPPGLEAVAAPAR